MRAGEESGHGIDPPSGLPGGEQPPAVGSNVWSERGEFLGTVAQVLGDYFRLHGERGDEHWFPVAVATASDRRATVPFDRDDFSSYSVQPPNAYEESEFIGLSLLTDEQREQRELVLRELSEQRRRLRQVNPNEAGSLGTPVEEELSLLHGDAVPTGPAKSAGEFSRSHPGRGEPVPRRARLLRAALLVQASYFILTGVWGNVHRPSFEAISGRKTDYWLVRCVGVLVLLVGLFLGRAATRPRVDGDAVALAIGSSLGLGMSESFAAWRRRASPIYLADAVIEATFALVALIGWRKAGQAR